MTKRVKALQIVKPGLYSELVLRTIHNFLSSLNLGFLMFEKIIMIIPLQNCL